MSDFKFQNLLTSVRNYLEMKKEAFRSEPEPANNNRPVKIAVGKNFRSLIIDSGRDALIEFYSPMCKHCQSLAPIWEELGDQLKDEDVDIIKFNTTANDWPESLYTVNHLPTIYWKPADGKPVVYTGALRLDSLLKFVAKHSTEELKGWDRWGVGKKNK